MERLVKDFIEPLVSQSWVKTGIEAPICFHDELHVSGNGSTNSTKRVPRAINASPARSFLQKGGHLSLTHPAEWFLNIRQVGARILQWRLWATRTPIRTLGANQTLPSQVAVSLSQHPGGSNNAASKFGQAPAKTLVSKLKSQRRLAN